MTENIQLTRNPAADLNRFLSETHHSTICVVADDNTKTACYPLIQQELPPHSLVVLPAGEAHKNLNTCQQLWQAFTDLGLDRHAVVIVLGGGVLGDMAGFCAATYKRGIRFILLPTTLLAQVDSSIGGKLGVDFNHFKNHIGVFQFPALTLISSMFLKTLPSEELRSGFAEVIKHTLIADAEMWSKVSAATFPEYDWDKLIYHSVAVKRKIVGEDPRERRSRKLLNAGHTIGHAIETHMLKKGTPVLHGEAVAAGLLCESWLATRRGLLHDNDFQKIATFIRNTFGTVQISEAETEAIATLTLQDKKNLGNKILCVLLERPGKARWDCAISLEEVKGALSFYRTYT